MSSNRYKKRGKGNSGKSKRAGKHRENRRPIKREPIPEPKKHEFVRSRLAEAEIEFIPYGSAREVGRSAYILQDKDRTVLLEAGIKLHPNEPSSPPTPVQNHVADLDAIILSHAHVDHSGYIPNLYHNGFEGNTYMTDPTLDLAYLLWKDHLKIEGERFWTEDALEDTYENAITMEYKSKQKIMDGVTLEFYNAGHILGSAITVLDWDGYRVLFSGDINDNKTPLFNGYEMPEFKEPVDLAIVEGTNGCAHVPLREEVGKEFVHEVLHVLNKENKVLIPTFAVGRSQEILILLTEYIKDFPIYVDGMINKVNEITKKYLNRKWVDQTLIDRLKQEGNFSPFEYENIFPITRENYDNTGDFRRFLGDDDQPSIICTTSGMLMPSPAHTHLLNVGDDHNNLVAFVGYQAEGTLGREIIDGARQVELNSSYRRTEKLNLSAKVMKFNFSGHSSADGIKRLVDEANARNTVIVHSEESSALELAKYFGRDNVIVPEIQKSHLFNKS